MQSLHNLHVLMDVILMKHLNTYSLIVRSL